MADSTSTSEQVELITGHAGTPHIDSSDIGAFNAGMFGEDTYIIDGCDCEVGTNSVTISAGNILFQGRHVRVKSPITFSIASCSSGYKRNDVVCVEYDLVGETESASIVLMTGTEVTGTPSDSEEINDSSKIPTHGTQAKLWRVAVSGSVISVEQVAPTNRIYDSIVARETYGEWNVIRFRSGMCVMYGCFIDSSSYTEVKMWDSGDEKRVTVRFPFAFDGQPTIAVNSMLPGTVSSQQFYVNALSDYLDVYMTHTDKVALESYVVFVTAIGQAG